MLLYEKTDTVTDDVIEVLATETESALTAPPEGELTFDKEHLHYFPRNLLEHAVITHSAALLNDVCRIVTDQ